MQFILCFFFLSFFYHSKTFHSTKHFISSSRWTMNFLELVHSLCLPKENVTWIRSVPFLLHFQRLSLQGRSRIKKKVRHTYVTLSTQTQRYIRTFYTLKDELIFLPHFTVSRIAVSWMLDTIETVLNRIEGQGNNTIRRIFITATITKFPHALSTRSPTNNRSCTCSRQLPQNIPS